MYDKLIGRIHSTETFGTVDGPGIRHVVFMQGCNLRCLYCHNPDTWTINSGKLFTTSDLVDNVLRYKSYYRKSGGGVTVSGGEPLLQVDFVNEFFIKCKKLRIHTAIDTSGSIFSPKVVNLLDNVDLLMLDIKHINPEKYNELTSGNLENTFKVLNAAREQNVDTWIRHVIVPGYTDNLDDLKNLSNTLKDYQNVKKVEILPFHKMGEFKWADLGLDYKLSETQSPSDELIKQIKEIFVEDGHAVD